MRNIIIGTAGHIDHGKTTLIKHLTGMNTDTLPEEEKRGMTINLGFAYYTLPDGRKVGIIDVPGHEKFIKNMVAGVSGIDFILLVVACDDGVMPQTIEHGNICKILGVQRGLVVLTKRDLVSDQRAEEVKAQIKESFKDSFIENLPVVEVSSKNENSYVEMKKLLNQEIEKIKISEKEKDHFRMAIDRVFTVKGFGTVVTGTTISGIIKEGDSVTIYPRKTTHKVKGIQNHGKSVEYLDSGNRCALNIAGIEKCELKRGDIISKDGNLVVSKRIDALFTLLNTEFKLKNNGRVRVHIGTTEVIGRVKLLKDDEITDSKPAYIQLELEEDIVAVKGDIGVIRNYSPLDTIGGIKILSPSGVKVKKRDPDYLRRLEILAYGDIDENIVSFLRSKKISFCTREDIEREMKERVPQSQLDTLVENKEIVEINSSYIVTSEFEAVVEKIKKYLEEFYEKYPLRDGVSRAEIKNKVLNGINLKNFNQLIEKIEEINIIEIADQIISLKDYKIKLSKKQKGIKDDILTIYKKFGFSPDYYDLILEGISKDELEEFKEVHDYLAKKELIQKVAENLFMMRGFYVEAEKRLMEYLQENSKITLAQYKDILETSRKFALILLETFDSRGITKREGEYRVLK